MTFLLLAASILAADPIKLPPLDPERYADAKTAAATAADLEKHYSGKPQPEAVKMLLAILRGSQMGPRDGWFGPALSHDFAAMLRAQLRQVATTRPDF